MGICLLAGTGLCKKFNKLCYSITVEVMGKLNTLANFKIHDLQRCQDSCLKMSVTSSDFEIGSKLSSIHDTICNSFCWDNLRKGG